MGTEELHSNANGKGSIDQLIILDRSIDLMSVLATQLTYEGLIGMNCEQPNSFFSNSKHQFQFQMKFTASINPLHFFQLKNSHRQTRVAYNQCLLIKKR